jgi:type VI secretion system protein VasD
MPRFSSAILLVMILMHTGVGCGGKTPPPAPAVPAPVAPSITIAAPVEAKTKATMTIAAGKDTNPDASGRPSPVVVRIYQLRTDAAFKAADFLALLDNDQKALGIEMISRDEFVLDPSERQSLEVAVAGDTRFVGAFANFRDYRNAQWRALIPAPRTGFSVSVERDRIVVSLAE